MGKDITKKELCEWSRTELRERFDELRKIVSKPKYACEKCGRAASGKKWLCQGKKLRP